MAKKSNAIEIDVEASSTSISFNLEGTRSTSSGDVRVRRGYATKTTGITDDVLVKAIFNHLQFMKARGQEKVKASEIARALNVDVSGVERVSLQLREHGVKIE